MNGEAAEYDAENPLVDADNAPAIEGVLDEETNAILDKTGAKNFASIIYNIVMTVVTFVRSIIAFFK